MSLGLKKRIIELVNHDPEWTKNADKMIKKLWNIFGTNAIDIQHIGSTSIYGIMAKPIIDIVVGIENFDVLNGLIQKLEKINIFKSSGQPFSDIILFSIEENGLRTYNIQVVIINELQWTNHIVFRDYLNTFPEKAREYEEIKIKSKENCNNDIWKYNNGKDEFIKKCSNEGYKYFKKCSTVQLHIKDVMCNLS